MTQDILLLKEQLLASVVRRLMLDPSDVAWIIPAYERIQNLEFQLTAEIAVLPLTQGQFTIIDAEDLERCRPYKWFAMRSNGGFESECFYAAAKVDGVSTKLHRFLMAPVPDAMIVDHVNHDTLFNRKSNLRVVDRYQSSQNRRGWRKGKNGSRFKGVYPVGRKWRSAIKKNGQLIEVGRFADEIDAARAYDQKAVELHGPYAVLNFPKE